MNHDVFISYSHKNITAAQAICHELEDKGIKCWMAPRDIPVGAKYASVISKAIVHSKIVVLVFSDYSARSPWVESEINIAFSNRKTIIPYKIDKTNYEEFDEFYLMLNNRHWIEAYPDYKTRFKELVTIVAQTLGRNVSASKPAMSTPTLAPAPIPTPTQKQSSETLMPTSKPNNLKRYWWVTICVLILGVAIWGVLPENSVEPIELVIQEKGKISNGTSQDIIAQDSADSDVASNAELEELRAEKARIEKENETLKHDNAELQHSNAELQNSNSDLQKNINDFKAKEAQQANNKKKENKKDNSYLLNLPNSEFERFEENGKYGYKLRYTGEIVITAMYDFIRAFSEGYASANLNGKFGFIDKTGKEVIHFKYDDAHFFFNGYAVVNIGGRKNNHGLIEGGAWGYIDKTGKEIIPLKYDDVGVHFSEGLASVKLNGKWGFVDKTDKEVIPLKYDYANPFSEGLAWVYLNGKYGYIDKIGKEVIPLKYDDASPFSKGKAKVKLNGETFYIDKNGNRIE